jgi:hypothetical protein
MIRVYAFTEGVHISERERMKVNTGDVEQKIRMAIGSAAAAAAIFAPLKYKWKGILSGVAAAGLITGMTGYSPFKHAAHLGRRA